MRLNVTAAWHSLVALMMVCALGTAVAGEDRHDWQAVGQLQPGDRIRMALTTGPVTGVFHGWTPETLTAGTVTAKKEDVLKVERFDDSGWGRGRTAMMGALIGFGGGFGVGVAVGGCKQGQLGPCFSRGETGAVGGALGAVIGAGIGAMIPRHSKELIYSH